MPFAGDLKDILCIHDGPRCLAKYDASGAQIQEQNPIAAAHASTRESPFDPPPVAPGSLQQIKWAITEADKLYGT